MKRFLPKNGLFGWLKASKSSALAAACAATTATATVPPPVPAYIRNLVGEGDTLLAFRETPDLFGDGNLGAVAAIRHKPDRGDSWENNPCDLVVLRKRGDSWFEETRSNRVVDCVHNHFLPLLADLEADDLLTSSPRSIAFSNERASGHTTYTFSVDGPESAWHLSKATAAYSGYDEYGSRAHVTEQVTYPQDVERILMSSLDPAHLAQIMWSRRVVESEQ